MFNYSEKTASLIKATSLRNCFYLNITWPKFIQKKSSTSKQLNRWKRCETRWCENQTVVRDEEISIRERIAGLRWKDETVKGEGVCKCCSRESNSIYLPKAGGCIESTWFTESWNSREDWLLKANNEKEESLGNHPATTTTQEVRGLVVHEQWQELYHQFPALATSYLLARLGPMK